MLQILKVQGGGITSHSVQLLTVVLMTACFQAQASGLREMELHWLPICCELVLVFLLIFLMFKI
jgi:hypothetical protein